VTRINLVPPSELYDQHLFAEFREIKMVPKALRRSLQGASTRQVLLRIPAEYTLNTGHVRFFYDKGLYLQQRYVELCQELQLRGVNYDRTASLDSDGVFEELGVEFNKDYTPTPAALALIRARIAEKVALRPTWYRKTEGKR
jgi:deoxyribonuclease (pyrimidine dimer)